jgi:hypothetical protein
MSLVKASSSVRNDIAGDLADTVGKTWSEPTSGAASVNVNQVFFAIAPAGAVSPADNNRAVAGERRTYLKTSVNSWTDLGDNAAQLSYATASLLPVSTAQQEALNKAVVGRIILRSGASISAGEYNHDALQDAINSGLSDVLIGCDTWAIKGGLVIDGKAVRLGVFPGMGGSPTRRVRLQQLAGSTSHLIHMSGHPDSRFISDRLDLYGANPTDFLTGSGVNVSGFVADGCASVTRGSVQMYDTIIRGFLGSGALIGPHRASLVLENASFLQCGGYAFQSLGNEDIKIRGHSEFGECGLTALYIDGDQPTTTSVGNIRLHGTDVYRGGMKFDGNPANLKDACNYYFGTLVTSVKLIEGENLGSYGHGVFFDGYGATEQYADHSIVALRSTANSRYASGAYSDIFTKMGGGHINLIAPIFSRFVNAPPSLPKYLVEIDASAGPTHSVAVISPGWKAPSTGYAGSYVTGRTNELGRVQWIDDSFTIMARAQYLRKAGVTVNSDLFWSIAGASTALFQCSNDGNMGWGSGAAGAGLDVGLRRGAADILELATGDSFRALGGFGCAPLAAAPALASRWNGLTVLANQTSWDPLARGSGGSYWVWWNGTAWRGMHEDASGGNLT